MKQLAALFLAGTLLLSAGCQSAGVRPTPLPTTETAAPAPTTAPPTPTPPPTPTAPATAALTTDEEIKQLLIASMEALAQPPMLDLSAWEPEGTPDLALKNIYYEILRDRPELKSTYDLAVELLPDGLTRCTLSYMPYKLGQRTEGEAFSTLEELIDIAREGVGSESVSVCVMESGLNVDDMNRALQQVGGGYMVCTLNRDATAIGYAPAMGYTMEECLTLLDEAENAAAELVEELTTPDMGEDARLKALYDWLTDNVRYDHRYYADRDAMPFLSTTATGAFTYQLAICGGYAHALELLCRAAGLEVYTVSGRAAGDYHMWNRICVDGVWSYYDATFDRGRSQYGYLYYGVDGETLAKDHQWESVV